MGDSRKISVVGNSGSGKSTAAARIASALGLARLELDSIRHQADWQELPDDEFRAQTVQFMDSHHDGWVIDGNYSIVQPLVWDRVTDIVWLDIPRAQNMRNIVWRTVSRALMRTELWNGNRERLRNLWSLDPYKSMIVWTWTRHHVIRKRYESAMNNPDLAHVRFARLKSREALEQWIQEQIL